MSLLQLKSVQVGFGGPALLESVDLIIEPGERIGLVGRNGAGKTTLLRLISGEIQPDQGEVARRQGVQVARLEQEVPTGLAGSVFDAVAGGLGERGTLISRYHDLSRQLADAPDASVLDALEKTQNALEAAGGWDVQQQTETLITQLDLPADSPFDALSGGLKRRVLLARALVTEPDLLLLDEPTNHLDIDAITWLESHFKAWRGTLLFISHDRQFVDTLATRIIELDRGRLTSWPGNFTAYTQLKEAALEAESKEQARFDKKLAQEEVWIRQGIKARRTRNEGRVRALQALRRERRQRRERIGDVKLNIQKAEGSGKLVAKIKNVSYRYEGETFIRDFSTLLMRGDKVGIVGPNGSGKTTLLQLILGHLEPVTGEVHLGTRLEIAYFDQLRRDLDLSGTVVDNVANGKDMLTINGQPRHVMSYLQDFLFTPDRARSPVSVLSGGERNRLLLAKLFLKPSNTLVLDEPTNDLDMETLELLEEKLIDYPGCILLVSHDRAFLNNVVTSILAFEEGGRIGDYVGGYDDWIQQRKGGQEAPLSSLSPTPSPKTAEVKSTKPVAQRGKRLGYMEKRELDALPAKIEKMEEQLEAIRETLSDPELYTTPGNRAAEEAARLESLEQELEEAYARWEALEAKTAS
ncbi:MAG: ATP-binding cassette domain-containing protein [Magnetococcales bacterium]|nr:ATP-binding cassette domain-containing protein [Magnetococcales bacterium]